MGGWGEQTVGMYSSIKSLPKNIISMTAEKLAERFRKATLTKQTIAPISEEIGVEDIVLAYDIQRVNTSHRESNGARVVGKKIGLTSKAVQQQLGVDQPDFGVLFHDMEVLNGLSVSMQDLMQPKVEAEIAFVLKHDLDQQNMTIADVIGAIDYALPAIEIVGSRVKDWKIKITDTVADNASASHYVLGHSPKRLTEVDVVGTQMKLSKNGEVVSEGTGASCLGSPLNATLWLAQKMVSVGNPLRAGELILSGAVGPMVSVAEGDVISARFENFGSVSVEFSK